MCPRLCDVLMWDLGKYLAVVQLEYGRSVLSVLRHQEQFLSSLMLTGGSSRTSYHESDPSNGLFVLPILLALFGEFLSMK